MNKQPVVTITLTREQLIQLDELRIKTLIEAAKGIPGALIGQILPNNAEAKVFFIDGDQAKKIFKIVNGKKWSGQRA